MPVAAQKEKSQNIPPDVAKSKNPAPAKEDLGTVAPLEKLPFQLQNGEKIMRELKPQFVGFMVTRALPSYFGILCVTIFSIVSLMLLNTLLPAIVIRLALVWIFLMPVLVIIASIVPYIQYGKSWYWITTRRVIGKRGTLGYSIDSIPLESVTDVVLSRSLLDRLLGISALVIVPMGGTARENGGFPDESSQNANFFPALKQETAMDLQRVLFNLKDEFRNSHTVQPVSDPKAGGSSEAVQVKPDVPRAVT